MRNLSEIFKNKIRDFDTDVSDILKKIQKFHR